MQISKAYVDDDFSRERRVTTRFVFGCDVSERTTYLSERNESAGVLP